MAGSLPVCVVVVGQRVRFQAAAPSPVAAASPVGAGDATLAGLLWATLDGCDAVETARRAVACGTAAAMQEGTGVGERTLVEKLLSRVQLRQERQLNVEFNSWPIRLV